MVETQIGTIDGKAIVYKQCTTNEEQQQIPSGLSGYWEYEGKKIYAPGEIVKLVTANAVSGKMQVEALTNPKVVQSHYNRLRKVQHDSVKKHYDKMIEDYTNNPNVPAHIKKESLKQLKQTQQLFSNPDMYPDVNGMFTATKEQGEHFLGKQTINSMPVEQQERTFKNM